MVAEFDPYAFLANKPQPKGAFDPDKFLADTAPADEPVLQSGLPGASVVEPLATIASSIVAEPIAGITGIGAGLGTKAANILGVETEIDPARAGSEAVERTRQALTFQPRTKEGAAGLQALSENLAPVAEALEGAEEFLGDGVFEATGSPELAALATTAPTIALEILGIAGAKGITKATSKIKELKQAKIDKAKAELPKEVSLSPEAEQLVQDLGLPREEAVNLSPSQIESLQREAGKKTIIEGIDEGSRLLGKDKGFQKVAQEVKVDPSIVKAADELGVDLADIPENVLSSNENFRALFGAVQSLPGSALSANRKRLLEKLATKAEEIVDQVGGEVANVNAGIKLKKDMHEMINKMSVEEEFAYKSNLKDKIGAATPTPVNNVMGALNKRLAVTGFKGLTPLEKKVFSRLKPKTTTKKVAIPGGFIITGSSKPRTRSVDTTTNPTWTRVDDLRKEINKARFNKGEFKDMDAGELDLYAGLVRADQKSFAETQGLGDNFEAAMSMTKIKKQAQESITTLFGKMLDKSLRKTLTPALKNLAKGDITEFNKVVNVIPENQRSSILMGAIGDFMINAKGADQLFDSAQFSKWFNELSGKKSASNSLFSNLDEVSKNKIIAMGKMAGAINRAGQDAITTGRINSISEAFKISNDIVEVMLNGGKAAATTAAATQGGFGALAGRFMKTSPKDDLAAKTAKVFGNPRFQKLVSDMATNAPSEVIRKQDEIVRKSTDWRQYIDKIPNISDSDKAQILQGSVVSFLSGLRADETEFNHKIE